MKLVMLLLCFISYMVNFFSSGLLILFIMSACGFDFENSNTDVVIPVVFILGGNFLAITHDCFTRWEFKHFWTS